ncbi:Uncharacterised protein [Vibrio cholerae]|nr:Uncharacterised protein [Vibrio cholerae]CSD14730.1 Uncharacterised protein [Vibrio cholerae]
MKNSCCIRDFNAGRSALLKLSYKRPSSIRTRTGIRLVLISMFEVRVRRGTLLTVPIRRPRYSTGAEGLSPRTDSSNIITNSM